LPKIKAPRYNPAFDQSKRDSITSGTGLPQRGKLSKRDGHHPQGMHTKCSPIHLAYNAQPLRPGHFLCPDDLFHLFSLSANTVEKIG